MNSTERVASVEIFNGHAEASPAIAVIPTYNEKGNAEALISALSDLPIKVDPCIADDNSPDGTADSVAEASRGKDGRVYLMRRRGKFGFGVCYLDAFEWILKHAPHADIIIQMDADFSHDPNMLPILIERARAYGVAVGSRYVQGGSTPDWDHRRVMLSKGGNFYARSVLRLFAPSYPVRDNTSGFIVWRRDVLERVITEGIPGDGYAFLTAIKYIAFREGYPPNEVPIIFRDRRLGVSKLNKNIIYEAIGMPWRLGRKFRKQVQS